MYPQDGSQTTDGLRGFLLLIMNLHLLRHALILHLAASQSANISEESGSVVLNQTSSRLKTPNGTAEPNTVTHGLHENTMMAKIEEELRGNQTFTAITEDDESFQDQETGLAGKHCDRDLLVEYSRSYCGEMFHTEMEAASADVWCNPNYFIRPYNELTLCLEELTKLTGCYFPNPDIQDYFLSIHAIYFLNCTEKEDLPEDAPHSVVAALTIMPVCLIPVLVYLVVCRS